LLPQKRIPDEAKTNLYSKKISGLKHLKKNNPDLEKFIEKT
jgi:hypothetical protein